MNWKKCKFDRFVKNVREDKGLIESLIKSSENSLESSKLLILKETTSQAKFSLAYDSIREILEALALKKGYKIYNHECYVAFLKEICLEEKLSFRFNRFRFLRNQIHYYAKKINLNDFKIFFEDLKNFRKEILEVFRNA